VSRVLGPLKSPRLGSMRRAGYLLLLVLCGCGDPRLGGVETGFTVSADPIDFGKALVGTQLQRTVTLQAVGRGQTEVQATVEAPFSVTPTLTVPGAGSVDVTVVCDVPVGTVEKTLTLTARGKSVELKVLVQGVQGKACVPSAVCRTSRFDLTVEDCVETVLPDDAACQPIDACLENGRCQQGECLGSSRSCDDFNPCTADACSSTGGCIHTPVICPAPTKVCHQSACSTSLGCQEIPLVNIVPCGPVDCVNASLCLNGECKVMATPVNTPCAPATPCSDVGRCNESHECQLPDAGTLVPEFSVPLPDAPVEGSPVIGHNQNVFFQMCPASGACQLRSFTWNGFERFTQSFPDSSPRTLVFAGGSVAVSREAALESYDPGSGALRWSYSLDALPEWGDVRTGPGRIAELSNGNWVFAGNTVADGGTVLMQLAPDGGVSHQAPLEVTASRLAIDAEDHVFVVSDGGTVVRAQSVEDGGFVWASFPDPGQAHSLSVAKGRVFAGETGFDADAGTLLYTRVNEDDAGTVHVPRVSEVLLGRDQAFALAWECTPDSVGACVEPTPSLHVHAFTPADGTALWSSPMWPADVSGIIAQASLVQGGGYLALTQLDAPGMTESVLQLFAVGKRLFACPLPATDRLFGASFDGTRMQILLQRSGGWRLETYPLTNIPLDATGWPRESGVSGTRRER
jgi:hypothetical protein